jgi:hypothetical protein
VTLARAVSPDDEPLFSPGFTWGLVLALLIPFALTFLSNAEPFPAILFPSGETIVSIEKGVVTVWEHALLVEDERGERHRLSPLEFLDPIPLHYLRPLIKAGFGFSRASSRKLTSIGDLVSFSVPRHVPSNADRRQARRFIVKRLKAAGFGPGALVVRREQVELDTATGRELSRKPRGETIVQLD